MTHATPITMPALGRPFGLGMLYDSRTDQLIPGMTLWNPKDLQENVTKTPQPATDFEVIMEDSLENKARALNVQAELKLSTMCGLCKVSGSANYMNDRTSSARQSRISLQFKSTSRFEHLTMEHLGRNKAGNRHGHVFEDDIATHVVTAITYGADAILVFDCTANTSEESSELKGKLKAELDFLLAEISAGVEMSLKNKESTVQNKTKITFYSDFPSNKNPVTFQDAVALYKELPSLCGKNGENTVPKLVFLYPLCKLDSKGQQIVRGISENLVDEIMQTLESIHSTRITVADLLSHCTDGSGSVVHKFLQLEEEIQEVIHALNQYELRFKRQILPILPKIRGGVQEESQLCDILAEYYQSPFATKTLLKWVEKKKREIELLHGYLEAFSEAGISFCAKDSELDKFVNHLKTPTVFSLALCVKEMLDPQVKVMTSYTASSCMSKTDESVQYWFENGKRLQHVRAEINRFINAWNEIRAIQQDTEKKTPSVKFVVYASHDTHINIAKTVLYQDGIGEDFIWPTRPVGIKCDASTSDSLSVSWEKDEQSSASCQYQIVKHRPRFLFGSSAWTETRAGSDVRTIKISDLLPETEYQIIAATISQIGIGMESEVFGPVTTKSAESFVSGHETFEILEGSEFVRMQSGLKIYKIVPRKILADRDKRCSVFEIGKFSLMQFPVQSKAVIMGLENDAQREFADFLCCLVSTMYGATVATDIEYEIELGDIMREVENNSTLAEIRIHPPVNSPVPFSLRIFVLDFRSKVEYWKTWGEIDWTNRFLRVSSNCVTWSTHHYEESYDKVTLRGTSYRFFGSRRRFFDNSWEVEDMHKKQGNILDILGELRNLLPNENYESSYLSKKAECFYRIAWMGNVAACLNTYSEQGAETQEFVRSFPTLVSQQLSQAKYISRAHSSTDSEPDFAEFITAVQCVLRTRNWKWLEEEVFSFGGWCDDNSWRTQVYQRRLAWLIQQRNLVISLYEKFAVGSFIQLILYHRLIWELQQPPVREPYPYSNSQILTALIQQQTDKTTKEEIEKAFTALERQFLLEIAKANGAQQSTVGRRYRVYEPKGDGTDTVSRDTLILNSALENVADDEDRLYNALLDDVRQQFPGDYDNPFQRFHSDKI